MKTRRGFALAAAIMALVLIATLAAGALFASSQETHASESELLETRAALYAERIALGEIDTWNPVSRDSLKVGAVIVDNPSPDPPFESTVYVTRLDSAVFLIVGEGRIMSGGASRIRRRVAIAVRAARDPGGAERVQHLSDYAWTALYQM